MPRSSRSCSFLRVSTLRYSDTSDDAIESWPTAAGFARPAPAATQIPPDPFDAGANLFDRCSKRNAHEAFPSFPERRAGDDEHRGVGGQRLREVDGAAERDGDEGVERAGRRLDLRFELAA